MKRKGFTLIEILMMLSIMTVLMFVTAGPTRTLIRDIPRLQKDIETDTVISNIVKTISKDVEAATDAELIGPAAEDAIGTLSLKTDQGNIFYDFKEEQVTRSVGSIDEAPSIWKIKYGNINWQIIQRDKFKTVEIKTSIQRKINGKLKNMLKKSHLYFVGAALPAVEEL